MRSRSPRQIAAWLAAGERAGLFRVDPRAAVAIEALLRTRRRWEIEALASSLAALLARDGAGWQRIYAHCLATLQAPPPSFAATLTGLTRRAPGWLVGTAIAAVVILLVVFGPGAIRELRRWADERLAAIQAEGQVPAAPRWAEPEPAVPPVVKDKFVPPRPTPRLEQIEPERRTTLTPAGTTLDPPAEDRLSAGWLALWIAISAALAGLAARWGWFAVAAFQASVAAVADAADAARDELSREGDHLRSIYYIEPTLPLPRADVEEAATILGRIRGEERSRELDLPPTIRRTIDAGGRVQPVYTANPGGDVLVVLVDRETRDGHAYLDGVELVLAAWDHGGLRFERHDFLDEPGARLLEDLSRRREGAPILLFSRLSEARGLTMQAAWLMRLRAWPQRAWIDLDPRGVEPDERRWILDEAARTGLVRFPWTGAGLLAAARGLARGEVRGALVREAPLPLHAELTEELELWAACAACVPDPTWPQLAAVRLQIPWLAERLPDPRLTGRLLDRLKFCGWLEPGAERGVGPRLLLTEDAVALLLVRLRRFDAARPPERSLERMTRRLLLAQLESADLRGDPLAAQENELKRRFHRALLGEAELASLLEFADGPQAAMLRRMLATETRVEAAAGGSRWTRAERRQIAALTEEQPAAAPGLALRSWSWSHVPVALSGAGLVLAGWAVLWSLGGLAPPPSRATAAQALVSPELRRVTLDPPLRPDLVAISGKRVWMGSTPAEQDQARAEAVAAFGDLAKDWYRDERRHEVVVGDFEICTTEVTQGQWKQVMSVTELAPAKCGGEACDDAKPITGVTWFEAVEYLTRLTEQENTRRSPDARWTHCYTKRPDGEVEWNRACTGYRLLTEAEWERAARADSETAYFFGDDAGELCKFANGADAAAKRKYPAWITVPCDDGFPDLAPVGTFTANKFRIHDVHGNVWEWVWDRYGEYPEQPGVDQGGPTEGDLRVLRGGSFRYEPWNLRSANRNRNPPTNAGRYIGLRCARGLHPLAPQTERPADPASPHPVLLDEEADIESGSGRRRHVKTEVADG